MNKLKKIMLVLVISILVFIGLLLWFLAYSSTTDVSNTANFKAYINKPLIVKQASVLKRGDLNSNRFKEYFIDVSTLQEDKTVVKKYNVGDTIFFTSAKKYFSNHVGDSYYLIGKEKLKSGKIIEFEYSASFIYSPAIWETSKAFLDRRKLKVDYP
ncbi:hypothetical protein GCM10022291_17000 [Postechiella marina]|uniref:Uncharacterized protein n=1 Tax=Postechiella marina TaxID=943941 RepID=A0ABP8C808_9FLAO